MKPAEQAKLFALTALALTIATVAICVDAVLEKVRRHREQGARRSAWAGEVRRGREEQGR